MDFAYGLRADLAGDYLGGVIAVDDRRELDVAKALEDGGGVIVVEESDAALVTALDGATALERVPVPDGRTASQTRAERLYGPETAATLKADAKARGLTGYSAASKVELVQALDHHDELLSLVDDNPDIVVPGAIADLAREARTDADPDDDDHDSDPVDNAPEPASQETAPADIVVTTPEQEEAV